MSAAFFSIFLDNFYIRLPASGLDISYQTHWTPSLWKISEKKVLEIPGFNDSFKEIKPDIYWEQVIGGNL